MSALVLQAPKVGVGIDVGYDLSRTVVAQAGEVKDGLIGVHLDYLDTVEPGPVLSWLAANKPRIRAVAIDVGSPADILTEALKKARIRGLNELGTRESSRAQNSLLAELKRKAESTVRLPDDGELRAAVQWAKVRSSRVGELVDRVKSGADVSPFVAAALAVYALRDVEEWRPPRIYTWSEEDVQRIQREAKEK